MSNTPSLAGPLEKLQQIKNNPVEVIKMYNMYKDGVKNYLSQKKQGLSEIKKFTIKSEDKAAFINRLEKLGIAIDSYAIEDDKLNGTFSIEFIDPQAIDMVNQVLRRSSKINQVKSPKSVYTDKKANGKGSALKEVENPKDVIKLDVPLFIRLLEYAREDAKTDMDLHDVAENIISMASEGRTLNMNDYNKIISKKMMEDFNPEEYEWEIDPELLGVGELDRGDSVKCKILTVNGEEETISFSLEDVGEEVGLNEDTGGICRAIDSRGVIYEMECTLFNTGLDGYYITDVDGDTLTVAN
jgi:hypothetical protein